MAVGEGLTPSNIELIGFVVASIFSSAINNQELRHWAEDVIRNSDVSDMPEYIFDLVEFDDVPAKLFKIIGFVPTWDQSDQEEAALYGIAAKRGADRYEWPVPKDAAARALAALPYMETRFREVFPFIQF